MLEELKGLFPFSPSPPPHEPGTKWVEILGDALKSNDESCIEEVLEYFVTACLPQMPHPTQASQTLRDIFGPYSSAHKRIEIKVSESQALATFLERPDDPGEAIRELQQILQRVMSGSTAVKVDEAIERSLDTHDQKLRPEDVGFVSQFSEVVITLCVKIAYLYMLRGDCSNEDVDSVSKTITRGSRLLEYLTPEMGDARVAHSFLHARTLELRCEFLRASKIYFEIARNESESGGAESSLKRVLGGFCCRDGEKKMRSPAESAFVCAVLAQPCPERSSLLKTFKMNENLLVIGEQAFFDKVASDKIIRRQDILGFEESFALLPREVPALRNAVAQHNLLCSSRVYVNIGFERLAELLHVGSGAEAESVAAQMISEGRLQAEIDQVDSCIYFKGRPAPTDFWNNRANRLCSFIDLI